MKRLSLVIALAGCGSSETSPAEDEIVAPMSDLALLTRISLDVRGTRPTIAELEAIEADPSQLDPMIDSFLHDDRFGDRVASLWGEIYLTESETWPINFGSIDVEFNRAELMASLGREPLEMLGHIAKNDLPYTEVVTADWTMANEVTAAIFPVERPEGEGWLLSHYTDSRPAAGVLSTNTLWWRYTSSDSNANRKRANQASRILLCHNYLNRPIEFDRNVNLLDTEAINDAIQTNPGCVNCHVSLDPLASYFFGFWSYTDAASELAVYHPDRERRWEDYTGTPPAYYGEPAAGLRDLGDQIAGDNRFIECAVEQSWELLLRRKATLSDSAQLTENREQFLENGLTIRSLVRAVIDSPEYRSGPTDADGYVDKKMVTPDLLGTQVEDLTGFQWRSNGYDLLKSDEAGFRTLAGGADGYYVTKNADSPNATIVLVQERLAQAASAYIVEADSTSETPTLFTEVDFTETPDTNRDAMVAQLQLLHFRIFGTRIAADGPEVAANLDLWSELYTVEGDIEMAWTGVLSALLRDPDFLLY